MPAVFPPFCRASSAKINVCYSDITSLVI